MDIKNKLQEASEAYYRGVPIMTDDEWDSLYDKYKSDGGDVLGYRPDANRARDLPIPMFSLNKEKEIERVDQWTSDKCGGDNNTWYILTPKLDGISICVDESESPEQRMATTRGDGSVGQMCDKHYSFMNSGDDGDCHSLYSFGEAIMSKGAFAKYDAAKGGMYKNPRNLVGSQINADKINPSVLRDIEYIRYGMKSTAIACRYETRSEEIDFLNTINVFKMPYKLVLASQITHELMMDLYAQWSTVYEIDGVVIEVNSTKLAMRIGRESSGNPAFARAYKGHFDKKDITSVQGITWQVSKTGKLKPVVNIDTIRLSGVDVSNVTGYNARNIVAQGIGEGAVISVLRSGAVIPKIVEVHNSADPQIPTECPACGGHVVWEQSGVDIVCTNSECSGVAISKITAFFDILKCKEVGRGVIESMYECGYTTVLSILSASVSDFEAMPRYGTKKANNIYAEVHSCLDGVKMEDLMHASCCFRGIGSSTISNIREGVNKSDVDNYNYDAGLLEWFSFYESIKEFVKITGVETAKTTKLAAVNAVFTGFRDEAIEKDIRENGGKVLNGVTGACTHLIMAMKGSGTVKEQKAREKGIIIMDRAEFVNYMNDLIG